jgi:formylglycine-generating enzyme required for sulfatase activity
MDGAPDSGSDAGGDGDDGGGGDAASYPYTDAYDITWLYVPAGTFEMGCSPGDVDCPNDEFPVHDVTISAFEITETEITQAQYTTVTGRQPSHFGVCAQCPVEEIDWNAAHDFCAAVGGRLPSEAEWEYAARAETTTAYYCGMTIECLADIAWYYDNAEGRPHPVAELSPNAFGVYDMLGNVFEWVADCYHDDYDGAPSTGAVWEETPCSNHVMRGGCWDGYARKVRVSNRTRLPPPIDGAVGVRCAKDLP